MLITNLWQANFLDWLYLHTPIGDLIEKNFDVTYLSGSDGAFMEIKPKLQSMKEKINNDY